ncbi:cob(II)yrinic acid a,c-diamide reductase [Modestobacter roseus]|uniref:Cob(II)yrinic acid a,c-diamide reductase n=1 Tax=Modestobacter roseus TaxID=1181884 RepID=A0A562IVD7_9ACTN|nr:cob(II)yrinic acid a,c-diamide reductase [Modestobacter roseus]
MTTWPRPVPLIGDDTAASERAADPTGWALPEPDRAGLYRTIGARRDVRRYRPDPVPDEVLTRVLGAAHAAPSVGHSQPWRFVVVRDPAVRDRAAVLTDRERLRQAAQLEPEAGARLLDLQLEGVREAPLGVVVCCDRRTPAAGVLGRATFPDADLWSCAAAIQNLWLAARAEGLGLGWVTLFRPAELGELLALPDGVVTLGWLCLGWPDERPPAPGLERAGWSRRQPLEDVVLTDRWPATDPAPPPNRLRSPEPAAVVGARDAADRLLTPPGSLGVLDRAVDRAVALGRTELTGGTLLLAAADHPVTGHGVSAFPVSTTRDIAAAAVAGQALGATAARTAGLDVVVVDAGVHGTAVPGALAVRPVGVRGDLLTAPAMTPDDVATLLAAGRRLGAERGRRPAWSRSARWGWATRPWRRRWPAGCCTWNRPTWSGWVPARTRRWWTGSGRWSTRPSPAPGGAWTRCARWPSSADRSWPSWPARCWGRRRPARWWSSTGSPPRWPHWSPWGWSRPRSRRWWPGSAAGSAGTSWCCRRWASSRCWTSGCGPVKASGRCSPRGCCVTG